jgi:hypothetical protein
MGHPPGHPDLKGFGCKGHFILWLRQGVADNREGIKIQE